jgi:hypothetical protein
VRVIQTHAFFDPSPVNDAEDRVKEHPGVSFAWFRNRIVGILRDYSVPMNSESRSDMVDLFLDAALRGVRFSVTARSGLAKKPPP